MRPDPRRLRLESYPFVAEVPARFGDVDPLRHLNNVAIAGIYEEGRVQLHRRIEADLVREKDSVTVIAQVTLRYLAEGFYPATLQVASGILKIGGSSYEMGSALFQDGRCIGLSETVLVYTRERRAHPMPQALRDALSAFELAAD
jgi:acyl-CoA thioester hydrolase